MGNSTYSNSKYDDYLEMCSHFNVEPHDFDDYHVHEDELCKEHGYKRTYMGIIKIE